MATVKIDHTKSEQFAHRMLGMLNSSALVLMTSIGHRTGLFDTMKDLPPATCEHIAQAAGLNERYVREWLGAMVTGGVVEYYPDGKKYVLPVEHSQWLSRVASPHNIAVFAQYIPLLGSVEDNIIECFHKGGGVPYSDFERFQQVMAEDSGQTVVAALFDSILPLVPGLVERLEKGIDVLDVGCGSGRVVNLMAKTFHRSRFTWYDFTNDAIGAAKAEAAELGLTNVNFEQKDVTLLNEHNTYDLITAFDAIHNQARPDVVLV